MHPRLFERRVKMMRRAISRLSRSISGVGIGTFALLFFHDLAIEHSTCRWTPNGNDISNSNTGNVGIGTSTPFFRLDVTADQTSSHLGITTYGSGFSSGFIGRFARGTAATPSAVQSIDPLMIF